jgi:hypothetical protein
MGDLMLPNSSLVSPETERQRYAREPWLLPNKDGTDAPKPMTIVFTPEELAECVALTNNRQGIKDEKGTATKKYDSKQSDWSVHYVGVRGEAAISKAVCGLQMDKNTYARSDGGDADFTFCLTSNKTAQAKCRIDRRQDYNVWLYFNHKERDKALGTCTCCKKSVEDSDILLADYAILTMCDDRVGYESTVYILGYISRAEFLARGEWRPEGLGHGPRFVMSHRFLRPADELQDI